MLVAFALDARASEWLTMSAIARFGKRRHLTDSLAGYAISSLACALAPNLELFVAAPSLPAQHV